jgi:hypothetical protein
MPFNLDARVEYRGAFCLIFPLTDKANTWLQVHIKKPLRYGRRGVFIKTVEVQDVVFAMMADGLDLPMLIPDEGEEENGEKKSDESK